ncbi:MAG TPA: fasciclin domain-containing protein [Leptolyngbyaceae cyanobacterium M65_K2018_010]|nr:fasciclin domain-containing protein [Leptolyngbyaceae cyanobacterium M65_K2018_010]
MTPNTLRVALGLVVLGAAPVSLATFPQEALSNTTTPKVEQQAKAAMTIADIASGNENFEILTAALEAADLTEVLSNGDITVTVFAPTDAAFEALPAGTLEALLQPENRDQLIQILTYHVVDGAVLSTDLVSGEVPTLAGESVTVMVNGEGVTVNQANVVAADIEASNGVIHVIDSVLLPM